MFMSVRRCDVLAGACEAARSAQAHYAPIICVTAKTVTFSGGVGSHVKALYCFLFRLGALLRRSVSAISFSLQRQ